MGEDGRAFRSRRQASRRLQMPAAESIIKSSWTVKRRGSNVYQGPRTEVQVMTESSTFSFPPFYPR